LPSPEWAPSIALRLWRQLGTASCDAGGDSRAAVVQAVLSGRTRRLTRRHDLQGSGKRIPWVLMPRMATKGLENRCASLRSRGFESPSPLWKAKTALWGPAREAGLSRPSGEFGGKSVANSTALMGARRTESHARLRPGDDPMGGGQPLHTMVECSVIVEPSRRS